MKEGERSGKFAVHLEREIIRTDQREGENKESVQKKEAERVGRRHV